MDFTGVFSPLVTLADKLGMLQAVRGKLTRRPDPAAQALATVLEEVAKVYEAILSELSSYLSITFYKGQPPGERSIYRTELTKLESGLILRRIGEGRGHCTKINNIYRRFLSPWFSRVLSPEETLMMKDLFKAFAVSDYRMLDASDDVAAWLSQQASKTLDLVDDEKLGEANQHIQRARKEIQAPRQEMLDAIRRLYDLQAEFIGMSGAV